MSNLVFKERKKVTDVKTLSDGELNDIADKNKMAWDKFYKEIETKEEVFDKIIGLMFFTGTFIITRSVMNDSISFSEALALLGGEFVIAGTAISFDRICSKISEELKQKISDKKYGPALNEIETRKEEKKLKRRQEELERMTREIKAIDEPVDLTDSEKDYIDRAHQQFIDNGKDDSLFNMPGVKQFIEYTLHNHKNGFQVTDINDDGSFNMELYNYESNTPLGFYVSNVSKYTVSYCSDGNPSHFAKIEKVDLRIYQGDEDITDNKAKMYDYWRNPSAYRKVYVPKAEIEPIYLDSNGLKLEESRGRRM